MSYPNLPKSEYFQVFSAFRSCKASAFLRPQHQKSNKNLSLYRSKIFYRTDLWSIKAKTERILYGFASILTKSERKSVYKKHGSDNSFHPNQWHRDSNLSAKPNIIGCSQSERWAEPIESRFQLQIITTSKLVVCSAPIRCEYWLSPSKGH